MSTMPQAELTPEHFFADGMYLRWLYRPKGTLIVGKVHKKEHFYVVVQGKVLVTGSDAPRTVSAPAVIVSPAGSKRAVLALEDSICMTVHRTAERDLECIEAECLEPDDTALFDAAGQAKIDVPAFRELTARVIAAEKPGFWGDWNEAERSAYQSGDWREFSRLRGYTEAEIADYGEWRRQIAAARNAGLNPYVCIADLATEAAMRNLSRDERNEIALSSHAPFEARA